MRFFNMAGPIRPDKHYCLDPLHRFNLTEILRLVSQEKYFVLHAPRQTGKTSTLLAHLNQSGDYQALYFNVEAGQAAREDLDQAMQIILGELVSQARTSLQDDFPEQVWQQMLADYGGGQALNQLRTQWAAQSTKPLILLIDEMDNSYVLKVTTKLLYLPQV